MKALLFLLPAVAAAILSFALTPWVRAFALRLGAIDHPGERKVHAAPIPRMGGLAVIIAVVSVLYLEQVVLGPRWTLADANVYRGAVFGLIPILLVSMWDDVRSLSAWPRFAAQTLGATVAVGFGIVLGPTVHLFGTPLPIGMLADPLSVLWLVGVTNAFNIVDGLDGLAAGLGLISSLTLVAVFAFVGQWNMAHLAVVCAGGLVGFLPYNLYPARVFLGDTGATAIGFVLGCLTLRGGSTLSAGLATLLPLVLIGLPVMETAVSMLRRVIRGMTERNGIRVFHADGNHIHHRLLAAGVSHRTAVWVLFAVAIALAGVGLASLLVTTRKAGFLLLATIVGAYVGVGRLGYEEFVVARKGIMLRFAKVPVLKRALFVVFVDLCLLTAAAYLSLALKFDVWTLAGQSRTAFFEMVALLAPITAIAFDVAGMYRGAWNFTSVEDFLRGAKAVLESAVAAFLAAQLVYDAAPPLSVFAIYTFAMIVLVSGSRVLSRIAKHAQAETMEYGVPVLIYGAGSAGANIVREMLESPVLGMRPVGFVDDDPVKLGWSLEGVKVLGPVDKLEALIRRTSAKRVVVSSQALPQRTLARAEEICRSVSVPLLRADVNFATFVVVERRKNVARSEYPYRRASDRRIESGEIPSLERGVHV